MVFRVCVSYVRFLGQEPDCIFSQLIPVDCWCIALRWSASGDAGGAGTDGRIQPAEMTCKWASRWVKDPSFGLIEIFRDVQWQQSIGKNWTKVHIKVRFRFCETWDDNVNILGLQWPFISSFSKNERPNFANYYSAEEFFIQSVSKKNTTPNMVMQ